MTRGNEPSLWLTTCGFAARTPPFQRDEYLMASIRHDLLFLALESIAERRYPQRTSVTQGISSAGNIKVSPLASVLLTSGDLEAAMPSGSPSFVREGLVVYFR